MQGEASELLRQVAAADLDCSWDRRLLLEVTSMGFCQNKLVLLLHPNLS